MYHYLYLIQDKNDINTNIYKIGKTTQIPDNRFKGYIDGTYPIRISKVDDCHKRENELISIFKNKYQLSRGREYFNGDINCMIKDFNSFCDQNFQEKNNNLTKNKKILNNTNFLCELCNKYFDTNQHLIQHLNKKNKCNNKTDFFCNICNKYFIYKKNLNDHNNKNHIFIVNNDNIKGILQNNLLTNSKTNLFIVNGCKLDIKSLIEIIDSNSDINIKTNLIINFF